MPPAETLKVTAAAVAKSEKHAGKSFREETCRVTSCELELEDRTGSYSNDVPGPNVTFLGGLTIR